MKLSEATINKTIRNPQWLEQNADYLRSVFPSHWTPILSIYPNKARLLSQLYAIGITAGYSNEDDALITLSEIMSEFDKSGFIQRGNCRDGVCFFSINPQFGNTIVITA